MTLIVMIIAEKITMHYKYLRNPCLCRQAGAFQIK